MFLELAAVVLLLLALAFLYGSYRYILDKRYYNLPPGPKPAPFLGSLRALKDKSKKLHIAFRQFAEEYGKVFTFYLGPHMRMIVIDDAKTIQDIFIGQGRVFSGRYEKALLPAVQKYIKDGILLESGETWRKHRRFGMKAMHDFGMGREIMVEKINDEVAYLVSEFDKFAKSGEPLFPKAHFANAISNVVCSLVFGKRYDDVKDPQFVDLMRSLEDLTVRPRDSWIDTLSVLLPFIGRFSDITVRNYLRFMQQIKFIVGKALKEHRLDFDPNNIRDFPDLFIQAEQQGDSIELENFATIISELFAAGTETTTTAMTWTILILSKQPDIQKKCQEAVDAVIDTDRLPKLSDRPKLVYIDAVLHEVLRFASIAPLGGFHSNLENEAKIGNFDCPPYSIVVYNATSVHYDSDYWKEPEKFNPGRWIGEDGKLLSHSTHFLPFGIGPRICLGESLARMEYFLFFVAIIHRFEFQLETPKVSYEDGMVGIVHGSPQYKVTIKRRH